MGATGSLTGAEAQHPSHALLDQHNFTQVRCAPRGSACFDSPVFCCVCGVLWANRSTFRLVG